MRTELGPRFRPTADKGMAEFPEVSVLLQSDCPVFGPRWGCALSFSDQISHPVGGAFASVLRLFQIGRIALSCKDSPQAVEGDAKQRPR